MKFEEGRKKYKAFIYENYLIEESEDYLELTFNYTIENLEKFSHKLKIDTSKIKKYRKYMNFKEEYENIVFNLGMMELISYYKLTCCEEIIVKCGNLNKEQIDWYKKVYYLGLGEFFYINKIEITEDSLVNIIAQDLSKFKEKKEYINEGILIPIGGGKDSVVSIELLKDKNPTYFIVNPKSATLSCLEIVDKGDENNIKVSRVIDKKLINLNDKFLNGHIPITAIMCFITYLSAFISSKRYIAFSNESSASEATVLGTNINHQYSKSLEYEKDFLEYSNKYMPYNIKCFSFLRGLNEIQITKIFAQFKEYHLVFKSCNQGSKGTNWDWCCDCPKCLFVYLMLSMFLSKKELLSIFGINLLDKESLLEIFIELIGKSTTKPFECVGSVDEVNYVVKECIKKSSNDELPYLLKYYKDTYLLDENNQIQKKISTDETKGNSGLLNEYNNDNCLDEEFNNLVKGVMNDK